jgi:hypothetical protein
VCLSEGKRRWGKSGCRPWFYVLRGMSSGNLSRTSELRNKALSTQRLNKWRLNSPSFFRILGESELKNVKEFNKKSIDTCSRLLHEQIFGHGSELLIISEKWVHTMHSLNILKDPYVFGFQWFKPTIYFCIYENKIQENKMFGL